EPVASEPAPAADLAPDQPLEEREALAVCLPVLRDQLAELGQALRAVRDESVDDLGDRLLERLQLDVLSARELEVGNLVVVDEESLLDGRHGLRLEPAAADQVEERRRELER